MATLIRKKTRIRGFTGISFPFRVSNGGVVMSTTSEEEDTHIEEEVYQILNTEFLERVMEPTIYSDITPLLFEPNNVSLQGVLAMRIVEALNILSNKISCTEQDITFSVEEDETGASSLYAEINYLVLKFNTYNEIKVKVGDSVE